MEAVHKELFGQDDLEVAVKVQNGEFIGPISEKYLYHYYKASSSGKYCNTVILIRLFSILLYPSVRQSIRTYLPVCLLVFLRSALKYARTRKKNNIPF